MRVLYDVFVNKLQHVSGVSVPRCYFTRNSTPVENQLHGFSDGSERAFAAVVYLRTKYENGHIDVNIVASKSRVAPIKEQTIPHLELLGATILARLVQTISSTLMLLRANLKISTGLILEPCFVGLRITSPGNSTLNIEYRR